VAAAAEEDAKTTHLKTLVATLTIQLWWRRYRTWKQSKKVGIHDIRNTKRDQAQAIATAVYGEQKHSQRPCAAHPG